MELILCRKQVSWPGKSPTKRKEKEKQNSTVWGHGWEEIEASTRKEER